MGESDFNTKIYQRSPATVLGFHGCDKSVAEMVLHSQEIHLEPSKNEYDWLGNGVYFWLNDPTRAYEWARQTHERKPDKIKEPYVIGAVIDLGLCLNFCERQAISLLKKSYGHLEKTLSSTGFDLSKDLKNKAPDEGGFSLIRPLDCAVIEHLHELVKNEGIEFDTVYGYFQEGVDVYNGAGIKEKSHIQICVRNPSCIKGYFLPRLK